MRSLLRAQFPVSHALTITTIVKALTANRFMRRGYAYILMIPELSVFIGTGIR